VTEAGHYGQTYPVVGPDVLTGDSITAIYARHLERDVRYGGDDLDRCMVTVITAVIVTMSEEDNYAIAL